MHRLYGSRAMYELIDDIMQYLYRYHDQEVTSDTRDNLENYIFFKEVYSDLIDYIDKDNNGEKHILLGRIRDWRAKNGRI